MDQYEAVEKNGHHYPTRLDSNGRIVEVVYIAYEDRMDALRVADEALAHMRAHGCSFKRAVNLVSH